MVDRNRLIVNTYVGDLSVRYHTLADIKKQIEDYIEKYGPDVEADIKYKQWNDWQDVELTAMLPESDERMATRIALEEQQEAMQEIADRKVWERLNKKFSGTSDPTD